VTEQRYEAVLVVIDDGRTVSEVASDWGVSRRTQSLRSGLCRPQVTYPCALRAAFPSVPMATFRRRSGKIEPWELTRMHRYRKPLVWFDRGCPVAQVRARVKRL
jgi:hypothetical protein